ncbi:hypothetical protein BTE56_17150 [Agrobacterium pusense]|uniref:MobQ family relaxase n=1 Tax=Agrobacterium pusense TaxID=648995 RepID=UPI0008872F77|nr:hypothetical protein BTE56_17150 [Agrobacterium pusense]SDF62238.1 MobA/MobL family protein [Agrobacterium pusense]
MAIYHFSVKPIGRNAGKSAVAAIAYRTASRILNERECITHDFTAKKGVVHAEIILPDGLDAPWARDRALLWNAAEFAERRCDARVAREFEIALPHELSDAGRLALTRAFAADLSNRFGAAVDFAIHVPQGKSDERNIHAHVVMTTRVITADGPGEKTLIERENRWLIDRGLPTTQMQLKQIREAFAGLVNRHLLQAGLDRRVDHRSHLSRGLAIEPTGHMGVHAAQMKQRGIDVSRSHIDDDAARRNAELIRRRPEQVLALITSGQSVFTRHDIARTWKRQLERERNSETWKRERCDVVEVPALTARSEDILTRLDALPYSEKPGYVKQMMNSAEGRKALEEAQDIDNALQTRFGTANLRNEHLARLRITADAHVSVERIKQLVGLVERTHRAALVEKQTLTLGQTQRLGPRI